MLLIDGDFIVYRACNRRRDFIQVIEYLENFLDSIMNFAGDYTYKLFLSPSVTFRHTVASSYKATRPRLKPPFFKEARQYMVDFLRAEIGENIEADDLCGLNQAEDTVIVGEDKDLLTIPGNHIRVTRHYNPPFYTLYVTQDEALRNFFVQMLCGDVSDNIKGLKNPGKAHHTKPPYFTPTTALAYLKKGYNMERLVRDLYEKQGMDYEQNHKLLWILRK